MAENELQIIIKAVDEATATLKNIEKSVSDQGKKIQETNKETAFSFQNTANSLLALGNIASSVDRVWSSYQNLQIRVENANERLANAQDRVSDAQLRINRLLRDGKAGTDEYQDAQNDLIRATRNLTISQNNLERVHNQALGTYINMGTGILTAGLSLMTFIQTVNLAKVAQTAYNVVLAIGRVIMNPFAGAAIIAAAGLVAYKISTLQATQAQEANNISLQRASYSVIRYTSTIRDATAEENRLQMSLISTNDQLDRRSDLVRIGGGTYKKGYEPGGSKDTSYKGPQILDPSKKVKIGDAIIRPNGQIIETDPNDTLFATKNGMGGIIITGNNIYGTSPDDIANAILLKLRRKISI